MPSIIEAAPYYHTARMAKNVSPFDVGQYVSVKYTRTVYNHYTKQDEDLFNVWSGSGQEFPSELFANALDSFCI
jgi:hypothetical protein